MLSMYKATSPTSSSSPTVAMTATRDTATQQPLLLMQPSHVTLDNLEEEQDRWLRAAERARAPARFLAAAAAAAAATSSTTLPRRASLSLAVDVLSPTPLSSAAAAATITTTAASSPSAPPPPYLTSPRSLRVCAEHGVDAARDLQKLSLEMHLHRVCNSPSFATAVATQTSLPLCDAREATRAFQCAGVGIGTVMEKRVAYTSYSEHERRRIALLATLQAARHRLVATTTAATMKGDDNSSSNVTGSATCHNAVVPHWSTLGVVRSVSRSLSHEPGATHNHVDDDIGSNNNNSNKDHHHQLQRYNYYSGDDHTSRSDSLIVVGSSSGGAGEVMQRRQLPYTPRDAEALRVSSFGNRGVVDGDVSNPARVPLSYRNSHSNDNSSSSNNSNSSLVIAANRYEGQQQQQQRHRREVLSTDTSSNNNNSSSNTSRDENKDARHGGVVDDVVTASHARHTAPFLVQTTDATTTAHDMNDKSKSGMSKSNGDGSSTTASKDAALLSLLAATMTTTAAAATPHMTAAERAAGFVYYCANARLPT